MAVITKQVISPLDIATRGRLSRNPITIATRGYIVYLTEEIIDVGIDDRIYGGVADDGGKKKKERRKKVITAKVHIGNETFVETVETYNLKIQLKDVQVEIIEETDKPKIRIILPEVV